MQKKSFLSCHSCDVKEKGNKKRKFPKICIGHAVMVGAFIYILLTQIFYL